MPEPLVPDSLWVRVAPLLPKPGCKNRHVQYAGRKRIPPRKVLTGIIFVLKTGVPWEHLPATSLWPSGRTCLRQLTEWHRQGVWYRLLRVVLDELQHEKRLDWRRAIIDSSSIRASRGGEKTGPSPVDRRKRGSKHHVLVEAHGIPLAITLTEANRHDITQLLPLLEKIPPIQGRRGRPRKRPKSLLGDRAYDSEPHRRALKKRKSNRY